MRAGKLLAGCSAVAVLAGASAARADLEISNHPTLNVSCSAGVCTATADKARLNATDLANMLASGDVAVKTGAVTGDIALRQPLSWTSASRLTLDAKRSVEIDRPMSVAGSGALTIVTNDGGKNGEFIVFPERGSVQFWDLNSSLVIDGQAYTLVGDIKTLATDIAANPSGFYALAKDYDASADGTYSMSPVATGLAGVTDGLGNRILNLSLTANQTDLYGLFKAVLATGTVRNFGLTHAKFLLGSFSGAGLLVANNLGHIRECWAGGNMEFTGGGSVGGLVGANPGSMVNSFARVSLLENSEVLDTIGGLAGTNKGNVTSSFASGSVAAKKGKGGGQIGGLVGDNGGAIQDSYSRSHVAEHSGKSQASYGGLIGAHDAGARVASSYAAGPITAHNRPPTGGGLIGIDNAESGSIANSYWDIDMGISDPSQGAGNVKNDPGITGLTTEQLQSSLPDGFSPKVWALDPSINNGFPYLRQLPIR